eukprot:5038090-Ditylum_brightwellii.AAC.1
MAEGLHADYVSIAIYALSRAFLRPNQLVTACRRRRDDADGKCDDGVELGDDDELQVDEVAVNAAGNDSYFDPVINAPPEYFSEGGYCGTGSGKKKCKEDKDSDTGSEEINKRKPLYLPSLERINREILYDKNPDENDNRTSDEEEKAQDPTSWYEYDDSHISNSHRFYTLNGLASGLSKRGLPLTLDEITAAGLAGLGARSRIDAERDMVRSPLFEQFVSAVRAKGFFKDAEAPLKEGDVVDGEGVMENDIIEGGSEEKKETYGEKKERLRKAHEIHVERYRKVVAKFRTKLASKAEQQQLQHHYPQQHSILSPRVLGDLISPSSAASVGGMAACGNASVASYSTVAMSAAERQKRRRAKRVEAAKIKRSV